MSSKSWSSSVIRVVLLTPCSPFCKVTLWGWSYAGA